MRWNLLKTFDKIYTIDLHGNAKKRETAPDGSPDVNVFDIEQGVSINFFIKTRKKRPKDLGEVQHYEVFGERESKYDYLLLNTIESTPYQTVLYQTPHFFFRPKDFKENSLYEKGFKIIDLFLECSLGVLSKNDDIMIKFFIITKYYIY